MSGRVTAEQTPDIEAQRVIRARLHTLRGHDRGAWRIPAASCAPCDQDADQLAQALAPVLAAAVREARAAELREAAADLTQLAVIEFDARPNAPRGAAIWDSAQWLKDRADRIAVDAPEVCACPNAEVDRGRCVLCGKPFPVGGAV